MKIKEIKKMFKNEFADVEVYKYTSKRKSIHTDNIKTIANYNDDCIVIDFQLMDEEDYNSTIKANDCIQADFGELYDNKNARVLVVII